MNSTDVLVLLPVIVIAATAVLVMLMAAFQRDHQVALLLTLTGLVVAFATLFVIGPWLPRQVTPLIIVDGYAVFYIGLLLVGTFVVALLSYSYMEKYQGQPEEFYLLLLLATLGSCVLVISDHFMSFFLGLELLSVSLYALIAYLRQQERRIEASIKYLVLAGAAAALLLFGMALIYAEAGTMSFSNLLAGTRPIGSQGVLLVGLGLITLGISFKLGLVPLHIWTPDVYQGAPAPVTGFVSTVSKGGMLALALRYFPQVSLSDSSALWILLAAISIASMLIGNTLAVRQNNVKRMLAYSSIAHAGYILVALTVGTEDAISAAIFYVIAYTFFNLGAFTIIALLETRMGAESEFEELSGLAKSAPYLSLLLAVFMFALSGFPPTVGFFGKFYIFRSAVEANYISLAVIGVLNSFVSVYYYLRVVKTCYFDDAEHAQKPIFVPATVGLTLVITTAATLGFGLFPQQLLQFTQQAIFAFL